MNKKNSLEISALLLSGVVVIAGIWFWGEQIGDVLEVLEMAYG